jgi:hypothetical protein
MTPAFQLAAWYSREISVQLELSYSHPPLHRVPVEEMLASAVQLYLDDAAQELPDLAETTIQRVICEPDEVYEHERFTILFPFHGYRTYDLISEDELMNTELNLVRWVQKRMFKSTMTEHELLEGFHIVNECCYLDSIFSSEFSRLEKDRLVAKPPVIVAMVNGHHVRALIDSGSLGDLISTTVVDQLALKRDELAEPITLQLAVQGSRSKINHSVSSNLRYQDVNCRRTFFVTNLSGYDMILGTSWLFKHKVTIGLTFARDCYSSRLHPRDGHRRR